MWIHTRKKSSRNVERHCSWQNNSVFKYFDICFVRMLAGHKVLVVSHWILYQSVIKKYLYVNICSYMLYIYIYIYIYINEIQVKNIINLYMLQKFLLFLYSHGWAKAGWPARTYIQRLCADTGCSPEDLPEAMDNKEGWRERVRDIRAMITANK